MAADPTSMLTSELQALIPSAGSVTAIYALAPTLVRLSRQAVHLNISEPRQLLDAGIEWMGKLPGRTQDGGARVNYSYRDLADALKHLFGPDATSSGAEARYEQVAKVFGNTTAISGRRLAPRLSSHLAAAIVSKVLLNHIDNYPQNESEPDQQAANVAAGTEFLLERADSITSLINLAKQSKLLLTEGWHEPLRDAFRIRFIDESSFSVHNFFDWSGHAWTAPERLSLATILLSSSPTAPNSSQKQLLDMVANLLQSHETSRTLSAALTFLRERAALALARIGDPRPGVSTVDRGVPDHVFSDLPSAGDKSHHVFMAIYPVTCAQFLCNQQLPAPLQRCSWSTSNHPITFITTEEAEDYCDWYSLVLADSNQFRVRTPSGEIRAIELPDTWKVTLPARDEIAAATGGGIGLYPWSTAIEDSVGIARRLSYNRIVPVGLFADELAPGGAYDLSGLIWQWLSEPWQHEGDSKSRRYRCVYGGGYGKNINFFRNGTFLGAMGNTRRIDRGFRMVLRAKF